MRYILERTTFGWCWWDLVALIILVGVIVYTHRKMKKMKQYEEELNDRLAAMNAQEAVTAEFEATV